MTVPYAKEFTLTAQMKNERAVSKLDDVDVTFSYPLELTTHVGAEQVSGIAGGVGQLRPAGFNGVVVEVHILQVPVFPP